MKKVLKLIFLLIFVITLTGHVQAQEDDISLSISPSILEIRADPPALVEARIKIKNGSSRQKTLSLAFRSIKGNQDSTGVVELKKESELEEPDVFIRSKIKVLEGESIISKLELSPNQEKTLTMIIDLDEKTPHQDYYLSLLFISDSSNETDEGSGAQAVAGIGTHVLLTVGEKAKTQGFIKSFTTPRFLTSGPVPFSLEVANSSNHFIKPTGKITITDMFGNILRELEILPQYIFARSSRYLNDDHLDDSEYNHPRIVWDQKSLFGFYTAELKLKLSNENREVTDKITFFALPTGLVILFLVSSFVLGGIYIKVIKRLKRHE